LFRLTSEALDIIQNSQKETIWPEFARILSSRPAWIFQSNPKYYDIEGALKVLTEMTWLVNQYQKQIRAGDTVYIWKSGEEGGIIAAGTIITDPAIISMEEKRDDFVIDKTKFANDSLRVRIRIDNKLSPTQRKRRKDLQNHPVLSSLEIVNFANATNFIVKPEQARVLHDFIFGNGQQEPEMNAEYPLDQCSEDTGLGLGSLEMWVRAIKRKGQAILYGPPGTGKTYIAELLAMHLIGGGDGFIEVVQFHPAYAYEDFIQGIRPQSREDGILSYPMVKGRFLEFCEKAESRHGKCVLIIDEINRANLARVFGELMYLMEYRDREIPLSNSGTLRIPSNVHIIGTMNTADKSIALVDYALRRRFAFLPLYPDYEVLRLYHQKIGSNFPIEGLIQILRRLNGQIGDRHYEVGISFFLRHNLGEEIEDIWKMEIMPYLEEYFFDQPDKISEFDWDKVKVNLLT
jgi:5-methylcytosine-specific restriction enzyme B